MKIQRGYCDQYYSFAAVKNRRIYIILALLVLLSIGAYSGYMLYTRYIYTRESIVLRRKDSVDIFIKPDNPATQAAANYLSYALEQALGAECTVVTEREERPPRFSIICDEKPLDEEAPVYTVTLENGRFAIFVSSYNRCFESVKAVADRWLQEDCGLKAAGELRVSQAMISRELSFLPTVVTGTFRVLTQNLYYDNDAVNGSVEQRAERFFHLVEDYQPELIGVQECSLKWIPLLQESLGEQYGYLGIPREGENANDTEWDNAILYRKDRFRVADRGVFWLSNTPDVPQSGLKNGEVIRSCTWAVLTDTETGKSLLFSNTHLHNRRADVYQEVRAKQAEILFQYLRGRANKLLNYPGFLTGDFNGKSDEAFYSEVTSYYEDSRITAITDNSLVDYSYQNFGADQRLYDYCFHSPRDVTILDYQILDDQFGGFISDHYGILVTALIN